jgi:myotubularin-related protein 9
MIFVTLKVCKSYPKSVVVPKNVPDEEIVIAATFRQGGRFPVLCYRHENGAVLLRSGEPLVGPSGRRCKEDERLINAILGPGKRGYIIDTRAQSLAQTAKVSFKLHPADNGIAVIAHLLLSRR